MDPVPWIFCFIHTIGNSLSREIAGNLLKTAEFKKQNKQKNPPQSSNNKNFK